MHIYHRNNEYSLNVTEECVCTCNRKRILSDILQNKHSQVRHLDDLEIYLMFVLLNVFCNTSQTTSAIREYLKAEDTSCIKF